MSEGPKESTAESILSRAQLSKNGPGSESFKCLISEYAIIRSARFLFHEPNLSMYSVGATSW